MLELRKEIFADERDDNLKEIGKPTQRQDMIGHVTGNTTFFDDHKLAGLLHLKVLRSPHHHARIRRIDTTEAERAPGVRRVIRGARCAAQSQHAAEPLEFRQGRRAVAGDRQGPLQGRADRRDRRQFGARGIRGAGESARRLRSADAGVRRRGSDQARRAGGQRDLSEEHLRVSRQVRSPEAALRRRGAGVRAGRPRARTALPDVADRARARPRPTARSRRRKPTAASSSTPARRGCSSRSTPRRRSSTCSRTSCTSSAARSAAASAARSTRSPSRSRRSASMLTGRPVRYVLGREEEMQFGSPRGAERIYVKDAVMKDGRDHRPQGAQLFRQRRLYAAVELRGHQMRGAHSGAVHDPERPCRHLLRLHQPRAGDRDARLRRHGGRFRDRMPDGQARASHRHGPDGVPHPQRLSRRRHEGAPARGEEHRADRMRAGRGREGEMADPRRIQAHVLARRAAAGARAAIPQTKLDGGAQAPARARAAAHEL